MTLEALNEAAHGIDDHIAPPPTDDRCDVTQLGTLPAFRINEDKARIRPHQRIDPLGEGPKLTVERPHVELRTPPRKVQL